jgi:hypothetical protein
MQSAKRSVSLGGGLLGGSGAGVRLITKTSAVVSVL